MTLPAYALDQPTFPQMYERHLVGPLFRPWAEALVHVAAPQPGEGVLDVACGTGIVARLAAARVGAAGRVAGIDVSAQMLEVAATIAPAVDWRAGDAAALPLRPGESFDVVLCQQGLQFFRDRAAAAREMRRATAPGGRLAVSVWRGLHEAPVFRETHAIAERRIGPVADARFGFGDEAALQRLLSEAGFRGVRVREERIRLRLEDPATFARLNATALVGMSAASKAMTEEERAEAVAAIAAESLPALRGYAEGSALVFDTAANVATADA